MPLIPPTIGRVVWVYPAGHDRDAQPLAGLIAYVHNDELINVGAFAQDGTPVAYTSVILVPAGEELPVMPHHCATWMPYQAKQAEKVVTQEENKPGAGLILNPRKA